jgi:GTP-binding protein EngB required for normal cell division
MVSYLKNKAIEAALMLVDSRMPPTESDVLMKPWLDHKHSKHNVDQGR